ncbi:MAG: hypothetical protein KDE51_02475, partial [Anaerolineales bacterium]|nr:hypothetical protein [Anaerolineales bacterium]
WETIRHFYPFLKENIVSTQAGPTSLPLAVTQVTIHQPTNGQELLTTPVFYINDTAGNLIPFTRGEGQAYLYQSNGTADPEDDDVLYLGSPSGPLINARGAAVGDRLCVFDNGHTPPRVGCLDDLQNSGATLTLVDIPLWQPEITVRPVNSTTLAVTVTQASVSNIHVQLFPSYRPTDTIKALTAELVHQGNGVYTGEFQFPITVFDGFIRVWEEGNANHESVSRFANAPGWDGNTFVGFGGNRFIAWGGNRFIAWGGNTFVGFGGNRFIAWGGNTFVGFGGNTFVGFGGNTFVGFGGNTFVGFNAPLASPDGQVILYNVDNILAGNVASSLQILSAAPELPTWLTPVGQVYRYTTQKNEGDNLVIQFQYLQRELPAIEEDQLRIYYLDENDPNAEWQRLENTTIDDFRNLASAKMPGEGLYALIATVELPRFQPAWNLFGYPINESRPLPNALGSIDGAYTSVYHYDAIQKEWLLYDAAVTGDHPQFEPLLNTLEQLEFGKGYWLYATEEITAYLAVAGSNSSLDVANQQFPPATYYGYLLPYEDFQPTVGMSVTAWVEGVNCGEGSVESLNGQLAYTIQIQAEDVSGNCGAAEKAVTLQVGSWTVAQRPYWDNSQAQFLTLSTLATTRPVYLPMIISQP